MIDFLDALTKKNEIARDSFFGRREINNNDFAGLLGSQRFKKYVILTACRG